MSPTSSSPLRAGSSARRSSAANPTSVRAPAGMESCAGELDDARAPGGLSDPGATGGPVGPPDAPSDPDEPDGGAFRGAPANSCPPRSPRSNPYIRLVY